MIDVTIRVNSEDGEFSQRETAVLTALAGTVAPVTATDAVPAPVESEAAPAPTPAPRAARKQRQTRSTRAAVLEDDKEPEPEPEPPADEPGEPQEDDVLGGGAATLEEAVALATDAVSHGKTAKVKAALSAAGAPKVRDLEGDQIQIFVDEMNKD